MKPKDIVVTRSKWYRGKGDEHSRLRRSSDGRQCCLGFACREYGVRASDITGVAFPWDIDLPLPWTRTPDDKATVLRMAAINDRRLMDDPRRERELRQLAKRLHWRLRFVD